MKRLRAYKTRLDLNNKQQTALWRCIDVARYVYNWALDDRKARKDAGTPTNYGEQKKRFNHLARTISDAGMGDLQRQIVYKSQWAGKEVLRADRWYPSSKTCSVCGSVRSDLALADREYECPVCGARMDRDLNAARNLAALGSKNRETHGDCLGS